MPLIVESHTCHQQQDPGLTISTYVLCTYLANIFRRKSLHVLSKSGCQVVAKWLSSGYQVVTKWLPSGCQVVAKLVGR